jgi:CPA2 family monovalent cation:H+ antiporter-2
MLFVAIGTLVLTPQLLKAGLRWSRRWPQVEHLAKDGPGTLPSASEEAVVIGLGQIGRQATSQLETMGIDVCLIDLSPVNLYAYAQQGFRTISGDAGDPDVLDRADAANSRLAVVCVPDDPTALHIVKTFYRLNPQCPLVVRCRYQSNTSVLKKAGAHSVVSEEVEASGALLRLLQRMDEEGGPGQSSRDSATRS